MDPTRTLPAAVAEAARAYADGAAMPVAARDAATVVLLRPGRVAERGALEVYLLRRHVGMAFAAGMSVFPGGGVDPRDATLGREQWAGPSPETWGERLGCPPDLARALLGAAVRETFEESGVLLAGPSGRLIADTAGLEAERTALAAHELSLADLLAGRGWVLRSDLLAGLGGWVTPVFEPRRYRTWFFVAALPEGQRTRDVSTESDQVAWWTLRDVVAAVDTGRMAMLPPTYATCCELYAATTPAAALALARELPWAMVEPVVRDGRLVVPQRFVDLGLAVGAEAAR